MRDDELWLSKLQASADLVLRVSDLSHGPMFTLDRAARLLWCNPAFLVMFGRGPRCSVFDHGPGVEDLLDAETWQSLGPELREMASGRAGPDTRILELGFATPVPRRVRLQLHPDPAGHGLFAAPVGPREDSAAGFGPSAPRVVAEAPTTYPPGGEARTHQVVPPPLPAYEPFENCAAVLDHIGAGMLLLGPDTSIHFANAALADVLEVPAHVLEAGMSADRLARFKIDRGDYGDADPVDIIAELTGARDPAPLAVRTQPSGRITEQTSVRLECGRRLLTFRDVTREQSLQNDLITARDSAETALSAKSGFFALVSHEIRTPMNGVLGMAAALAETELDAEQRKMLGVITQSGDVLLALLSDILDLARIEAGGLTIEEVPFRVRDIVAPLAEIYRRRSAERGLNFSVDIAPGADIVCLGDPLRLRQVIDNLLSNAAKFTAHGSVRLEVRRDGWGDATTLVFVVADTGPGIAPDQAERLFQPFTQGDISTTRRYGGTGLGLTICRQLVEAMSGTLTLDSAPGQGASFEVCLPAPTVSADRLAPVPSRGTAPTFLPKGLKILVAEDIETNRLVLSHLLRVHRAEVTEVADGAEAIAACFSNRFDAVIMDVMMPRVDGVQAMRRIRAMEADFGLPRTPIIALTANALPHQIADYLAAGADAHVSKPVRPDLLAAAIAACLANPEAAS